MAHRSCTVQIHQVLRVWLADIHCGSLAGLAIRFSWGYRSSPAVLLFNLEAVVVEKMTAAPLPLVESSDNYLSTSSEENSAEEVEDEFAEVVPPSPYRFEPDLTSSDSSVSSSSEESDSEDRLSNTSWYIFIYLHCCS